MRFADRLRVACHRLVVHAQMRRELIPHLRARRWQESLNEKGLQPPVRKCGSAAQRLVPQLVTLHLLRHIRALTEGGDITDCFGNNLVRRVRAQKDVHDFRVGFE